MLGFVEQRRLFQLLQNLIQQLFGGGGLCYLAQLLQRALLLLQLPLEHVRDEELHYLILMLALLEGVGDLNIYGEIEGYLLF